MLEKGKLVPNVDITGFDGSTKKLWDFRQKCHVLVLVGDAVRVKAVEAKLATLQKTLTWLGLEVVATATAPEGFSEGAFAVDRFGELMEIYPLDESIADRLEKDFTYYEACHC